jgi:hypothetical protein
MAPAMDGLLILMLLCVNSCGIKFVFDGFSLKRFFHESAHFQLYAYGWESVGHLQLT